MAIHGHWSRLAEGHHLMDTKGQNMRFRTDLIGRFRVPYLGSKFGDLWTSLSNFDQLWWILDWLLLPTHVSRSKNSHERNLYIYFIQSDCAQQ
jgi:hypothetical protein